MISAVRKFAKSWVAAILLGLLIVSFAIFGINDVFKPNLTNWVVKAGQREVSGPDFKVLFEQAKSGMEKQYQQQIPLDLIVKEGLDRQILNDLASQESLSEMLRRMGIVGTDAQVAEAISRNQAFFDPITGKFDEKAYISLLAQNNLTRQTYEQGLGDELVRAQFGAGAGAGMKTPLIYSAVQGAFAVEERDAVVLAVPPSAVPQPTPPTDAQLQSFMQENAARLTRPEFRTISLVRFSPQAFLSNAPIDEAAVQKQFDFMKDTLSKPELRSIVQISAKDAAGAASVAQRLKAGEDPSAIAKSLKVDPVSYADKPKTAIFDKAIAEAAFTLKEGEVSAPVSGEFGPTVVKVLKVTPGVVATLAEHRAEIEAKLRNDAAIAKAAAQSEAYDDAHVAGASMVQAAAKAGATVVTIGPFDARGGTLNAPPSPQLTPEIVKQAFSLGANTEGEIQDAGKGESYVVKVDKITPPALPPLAEIKPQLTQFYMQKKTIDAMQAKAEEVAARLRKGEAPEAVAAATGAKVVRLTKATRFAAAQHQALGKEVLGALYGAKPNEVVVANMPTIAQGIAVIKIEATRGGDVASAARFARAQQMQFTEQVFGDLSTSARDYSRSKVKVRTDLPKAQQAIGVDPDVIKAEEQKAKAASKKPGELAK